MIRAIFSPNVHWVFQPSTLVVAKDSNISHWFEFINYFTNEYPSHYILHTQHDCPSLMNSNLMISVNKLTHYPSLINSTLSGVILCFQFVSAASTASASATAKTFPSHIKTVSAKPLIFGTKNILVWGNVLYDLSMTFTQGLHDLHSCGVD